MPPIPKMISARHSRGCGEVHWKRPVPMICNPCVGHQNYIEGRTNFQFEPKWNLQPRRCTSVIFKFHNIELTKIPPERWKMTIKQIHKVLPDNSMPFSSFSASFPWAVVGAVYWGLKVHFPNRIQHSGNSWPLVHSPWRYGLFWKKWIFCLNEYSGF